MQGKRETERKRKNNKMRTTHALKAQEMKKVRAVINYVIEIRFG